MAESLCYYSGACMKQADCPDTHCQGRWEAVQLHLRDGGHKVVPPDNKRLYLEREIREPAPARRRFTTAEIACAAGCAALGAWSLYLFATHAARQLFAG